MAKAAKRGSGLLWFIAALGAAALASLAAFRFAPALQEPIFRAMIQRGLLTPPPAIDANALEVVLCGTGSPLPDPNRAQACTLVAAGGRYWLVDTGGGSWKRVTLMRRFPADKLAGVLLTHFHSDHIGDLGEVAMQSWVQGRLDRLQLYGGPGVERVANGFNEAYALDSQYRIAHHGADLMKPALNGLEPRLVANATGQPLGAGETAIVLKDGDLTITAFAVKHDPIKPAYGYRFDYKGRSVVVSGDTSLDPAIAKAAKGADVLVHEAQARNLVAMMRDASRAAGNERRARIFHDIDSYHTSPAEAAQTAKQAGVKLLVLTHLTPPMPLFLADLVFGEAARAENGPKVVVGRDGLTVRLPVGTDKVLVEKP